MITKLLKLSFITVVTLGVGAALFYDLQSSSLQANNEVLETNADFLFLNDRQSTQTPEPSPPSPTNEIFQTLSSPSADPLPTPTSLQLSGLRHTVVGASPSTPPSTLRISPTRPPIVISSPRPGFTVPVTRPTFQPEPVAPRPIPPCTPSIQHPVVSIPNSCPPVPRLPISPRPQPCTAPPNSWLARVSYWLQTTTSSDPSRHCYPIPKPFPTRPCKLGIIGRLFGGRGLCIPSSSPSSSSPSPSASLSPSSKPTQSPSPSRSSSPSPSPSRKPSPSPSPRDIVRFVINLDSPIQERYYNKDVRYVDSVPDRAILYQYSSIGNQVVVARPLASTRARRLTSDQHGAWYFDFAGHELNLVDSRKIYYHCVEVTFEFKDPTRRHYGRRYKVYTDREQTNSKAGIFSYKAGQGLKIVNGRDFLEYSNPQWQVFCPEKFSN